MDNKGWKSQPFVPLDGQAWPLSVAATVLDVPEQDLRDLVRIVEHARGEALTCGVIRMSEFSRQGRQPRAYPAKVLIDLTEAVREMAEAVGKEEEVAPGGDDRQVLL